MEKEKIRRFQQEQKRLGRKIAEAQKNSFLGIRYEQRIPSASVTKDDRVIVGDGSQMVFPTQVMSKGKTRVNVVMMFSGKMKKDFIGKILKRQFTMKETSDGFEIRSSFYPQTIAKF